MSTGRKVKVAVPRNSRKVVKAAESTTATSSPLGQKKVVEYFRIVHRDSSKNKFKRLKESTEDEVGSTKLALQSPSKMARLKSPQTSPSEKEAESRDQKWVLPETDETEIAPDSDILPSAVKLVESIENSTGPNLSEALPLPAKYERLLRLFDYTEVVVSWLETQGKRITLDEVMINVQRKLKSNYGKLQFAQILSVYPESYKVYCERRWMPIGGRNCSPKDFEYVIEPNLIDDVVIPEDENVKKETTPMSSPVKQAFGSHGKVSLISLTRNPMVSPPKSLMKAALKSPTKSPGRFQPALKSPVKRPQSPLKSPVKRFQSPTKPLVKGCPPKLEGRRSLRKLEFKNRLRKLVNIQHTAFLKKEEIEIPPDEELRRYHPDFDLDAVDDIIPAELPEIPKGDAGQPESMREYMKTIPDSSDSLPDKIKKVIKELRSPQKQVAVVADRCIPLSPKKYVEEKKNTSKPSLLERIRAKERERKRREMLRNPEMEQKKERLERISRSLLQCICSYYNLKRVGSMRFVELVDKLSFSIGSISKVEMEATISLLCEACSTYFKVVEVRGEKYVHLKDNNFSAIRDVINAEIKKCL